MAQFTIAHLCREQIDAAFPLVRMAAPELTLERWRRFARSAIQGEGGVLGAYAGDGTLHGVAAFRTDERLLAPKVLQVEPFVAFELNPSSPARAALCQALELLAAAKGCEQIVFVMGSRGYADPASPKAAGWRALGIGVEAVTLVKPLAPVVPARLPAAARRGHRG